MKSFLVSVTTTDGENHIYSVYAKSKRNVCQEAIKMHISNSYCDIVEIDYAVLL